MSETPVLRHKQSNLWKTGADYDQETSTVIKSPLKGGDGFCRYPRKRTVKTFSNCFLVFSLKFIYSQFQLFDISFIGPYVRSFWNLLMEYIEFSIYKADLYYYYSRACVFKGS